MLPSTKKEKQLFTQTVEVTGGNLGLLAKQDLCNLSFWKSLPLTSFFQTSINFYQVPVGTLKKESHTDVAIYFMDIPAPENRVSSSLWQVTLE